MSIGRKETGRKVKSGSILKFAWTNTYEIIPMVNFDHGIQTDLVLMDLSKAFDRVPHERLLYKLHWYGVKGHLLQWIRAFLMGRTQQVVLDGASSSTVPGVSQGSVLGPLLFIVYINDLPEYTKHCTVRLFADDCVLYRPIFDYNDITCTRRSLLFANLVTRLVDEFQCS